jgi:AcrR family transcriptional regulator
MAETQRTAEERARSKPGVGRRRVSAEKGRSSAEKRELIVEAAIEVFAEKGFHDTRISDIATRAGIAYGLVYHYFKNKEEILDTLFLERWSEFIDAVRAIASDGRSAEDKLLSIAAVVLSAHRSRPQWVKVLIFEIQRTQRILDPERVEVVGELFVLIAQILRDGQASGELREDLDPDLACYIFVGGIDIVVTNRVLGLVEGGSELDGDEGEYYVHIARTVVELFVRGMAKK